MRKVYFRKPVLAWALYDWANSAFATTVMAGFFPLFFKQYWNAGVAATESTFRLGLTNGLTSLVVALIAPLVGAIADQGGARVKLLALFTVLGAAMTAALVLVGQGDWVAAALLYGAASIGFWGGNQFYDSLLTDVSEAAEYDAASGYGYALGYLGGGLLFGVNALMVSKPALFGFADAGAAVKASFLSVAAWWLLFALPAVLIVREQRPVAAMAPGAAVAAGWRELRGTLAHLRGNRALLGFLLAYWFYIDGVNTIIKMAVDYGLALGFRQASLIQALLLVQFVGFPAALFFGWLGSRIGARKGILIALAVYTAVTVYAYRLQSEVEFFVLAAVIGCVQGGVQSLSRSFFGRLVPSGRAGEFFGFYNMMGKAAAILGPLLAGTVALVTGDSRLAILSIALLFVAGALLLLRVPAHAHAAGSMP